MEWPTLLQLHAGNCSTYSWTLARCSSRSHWARFCLILLSNIQFSSAPKEQSLNISLDSPGEIENASESVLLRPMDPVILNHFKGSACMLRPQKNLKSIKIQRAVVHGSLVIFGSCASRPAVQSLRAAISSSTASSSATNLRSKQITDSLSLKRLDKTSTVQQCTGESLPHLPQP